tara:strand:- start:125 stop:430 length:306 start_codon:yes stop_codon:yes gene_type:complete
MKQNKTDEIWCERAYILDKFFYQTRWLINCNKPLNHKNAILKENFDRFVQTIDSQDKRTNNIIETLLAALFETEISVELANEMAKNIDLEELERLKESTKT